MFTMRSKNSYMCSRRSVTQTPMGMFLRSLKLEIDFRARVTIAFWPVIWPNSLAAASSTLMFSIASPNPMLITIFCKRGTCMSLVYPNSFFRAGST